MAEANGSSVIFELMSALNRIRHAYCRAGSAITPEQENRELHLLGGNVMVAGLFNTAVSYRSFFNHPARNLAYAIPSYMHMTSLVIQCFTILTGITAVGIAWLLIFDDIPRQYNRLLLKVIQLLVFIASSFTIGMLLWDSSSSG